MLTVPNTDDVKTLVLPNKTDADAGATATVISGAAVRATDASPNTAGFAEEVARTLTDAETGITAGAR